jgi:hypothetical protein
MAISSIRCAGVSNDSSAANSKACLSCMVVISGRLKTQTLHPCNDQKLTSYPLGSRNTAISSTGYPMGRQQARNRQQGRFQRSGRRRHQGRSGESASVPCCAGQADQQGEAVRDRNTSEPRSPRSHLPAQSGRRQAAYAGRRDGEFLAQQADWIGSWLGLLAARLRWPARRPRRSTRPEASGRCGVCWIFH